MGVLLSVGRIEGFDQVTPLPEWVERLGAKQYDARESTVTVIEDYRRIYQALAIAWEALEKLGKKGTIPWKDSDAFHVEWWAKEAKDAIRRIEELK
jgi:hypothetical protein